MAFNLDDTVKIKQAFNKSTSKNGLSRCKVAFHYRFFFPSEKAMQHDKSKRKYMLLTDCLLVPVFFFLSMWLFLCFTFWTYLGLQLFCSPVVRYRITCGLEKNLYPCGSMNICNANTNILFSKVYRNSTIAATKRKSVSLDESISFLL